jgi:UDP-glucuronate 4-epimerase
MWQVILVTGCAGFIGFHLCRRLLGENEDVCGLDNLNEYYDVNLKKARLAQIADHPRFHFIKSDVADREGIDQVFRDHEFDTVVHLAAQVGVRYSVVNPHAYIDSNLTGFANVLEGCRHSGVRHLVFASSSSVYGANTQMPFSEHQDTSHPVSLYGATKKANELMAHAYARLYGLPCTGLRFFTVYGPWGRPDMALFLFTNAILTGETVRAFSFGRMQRDFTFIDDTVEATVRVMRRIPSPDPGWNGNRPDPATSTAPYRILNVGGNNPVELATLLTALEAKLGINAKVEMAPPQAGDVPATSADVADLVSYTGFRPQTPIQVGVERFVDWYREYYGV